MRKQKYTVFARLAEHDIGDPLYWSQVKATCPSKAIRKALSLLGHDLGEKYNLADFDVELVITGWPKFKLRP